MHLSKVDNFVALAIYAMQCKFLSIKCMLLSSLKCILPTLKTGEIQAKAWLVGIIITLASIRR